jgi:hypothetical protein
LFSCLAADVAGTGLGTQGKGQYATFDDGMRLVEIAETILT